MDTGKSKTAPRMKEGTMGFFEELEKSLEKRFGDAGQALSNAGQDMTRQAKGLAETARLKSLIAEKERILKEGYEELGKAYYDLHGDDENADGQESFKKIREAAEEIGALKAKIYKVKGVKGCPCCGRENPLDAVFCNQCGAKLPEEPEEEAAEEVCDAAEEACCAAEEAADEACSAAAEEVKECCDAAGETAEEVCSAAAEEVKECCDTAAGEVRQAAESIAETVKEAVAEAAANAGLDETAE